MSTAQGIRRGGSERWRTPALVTGSVVFHAVVLGVLGLRAVKPLLAPPAELPVVYFDIEPRPILEGGSARTRPPRANDRSPRRPSQPLGSSPAPPSPRLAAPATSSPPPAATEALDPWTLRPEAQNGLGQRGSRTNSIACRAPQFLTLAERAICDDRFGQAAARAASITGSGDPDIDSRFAREGAERLAAYAARREALTPGRAPCPETRSPIGDCAVEIRIDIWSSREGLLPRQRRDD